MSCKSRDHASIQYYLNILPPYFFRKLIHHQSITENLFIVCWNLITSMGGRSHCNCPRLNNSLWWHSKLNIKKILYKTYTYIFALRKPTTTQLTINNIFISIWFDFRIRQLQWLSPPMEVIKLQHPTKSSLWRSDDGLPRDLHEKSVQKNKLLCLHFDRFWHWKPCYYYIYWTLFSAHCLCYIHIDTTSSACGHSRCWQCCSKTLLVSWYSHCCFSDCSAEWLSRVLQACHYLILSLNSPPVLYIFLNLFSFYFFFLPFLLC